MWKGILPEDTTTWITTTKRLNYCIRCGKIFFRNLYDPHKIWPKRKYCSLDCTWKSHKPVNPFKGCLVVCEICGKEFPYMGIDSHLRGHDGTAFRHPAKIEEERITSIKQVLRKCLEYKAWRKAVFGRDHFRCVECSSRKDIEAHHLKTFSSIVNENNIDTYEKAIQCKELWDVDNGKTLCIECHKKTDTYLYKANKLKL